MASMPASSPPLRHPQALSKRPVHWVVKLERPLLPLLLVERRPRLVEVNSRMAR